MIYIRKVLENSEDKNKSPHEVLHAEVHELLCYAVQKEYNEKADKLTMRSMEHGKPYFVEIDQENREIISDIHFNKFTKDKKLDNVKEEIRKIKPDYVLITGDTIDDPKTFEDN